ncbi:MAG TPA: HNH endonuclease [Chthoniobacter sp.]
MAPSTADVFRFFAKVEVGRPEVCWPWKGAVNRHGYGLFWLNGGSVFAHRLAVLISGRTLDGGLTVDHECFNPVCCNPGHLALAVHAVNAGRTRRALSRFCARGHEFTPENTRLYQGHRHCRECANAVRRKGFVRVAAEMGSGWGGVRAFWSMEDRRVLRDVRGQECVAENTILERGRGNVGAGTKAAWPPKRLEASPTSGAGPGRTRRRS